jgi:hypothetical protein
MLILIVIQFAAQPDNNSKPSLTSWLHDASEEHHTFANSVSIWTIGVTLYITKSDPWLYTVILCDDSHTVQFQSICNPYVSGCDTPDEIFISSPWLEGCDSREGSTATDTL